MFLMLCSEDKVLILLQLEKNPLQKVVIIKKGNLNKVVSWRYFTVFINMITNYNPCYPCLLLDINQYLLVLNYQLKYYVRVSKCSACESRQTPIQVLKKQFIK